MTPLTAYLLFFLLPYLGLWAFWLYGQHHRRARILWLKYPHRIAIRTVWLLEDLSEMAAPYVRPYVRFFERHEKATYAAFVSSSAILFVLYPESRYILLVGNFAILMSISEEEFFRGFSDPMMAHTLNNIISGSNHEGDEPEATHQVPDKSDSKVGGC